MTHRSRLDVAALSDRRCLLLAYATDLENAAQRQAYFASFEIMERVMCVDPVFHAIAKANLEALRTHDE